MRPVLLAIALSACVEEEPPVDPRDAPVELTIPEVSPEDLAGAVEAALDLSLRVSLREVWPAHVETLDLATPGCPNFYAGTPDLDNRDIPMDLGLSWSDLCAGPGERRFAGWSWWDFAVRVEGDAESAVGATTEASRTLVASELVSVGGEVLLEVSGEASDSVLRVDAPDYSAWSHSSRFDATVTGSLTDPIAPGGLRADLFARTTGGDADTIELRGNVFLFEHRIAERFDSVSMNLLWASQGSTPPDGCAEEPTGWISVRDEDAFWYELVFQPRFGDDVSGDNGSWTRCNGCAAVYIRGLRQSFEVCPDLASLWEGALTAPDADSFPHDVRGLIGQVGSP